MIQHSEEIGKVMAAILAVQQAVDHVDKNQTNPHFGNSYVDLNTFLHALREPLAEHGLVMTQAPGMENGNVLVDTMLYHESGEWIRDRAAAPMQKADPQGVGSAITYLRRYSLAALFAIPQEDDDGNAASTNRDNGQQSQQPARPQSTAPTCPKCEGDLWDNRAKKRSGKFSAKSPDYACKDKDSCGWVFWIDGATEELKKALERLRLADVIDGEAMDNCLSGVLSGDLHAFRIAQDWVNSKEAEAQGAGA